MNIKIQSTILYRAISQVMGVVPSSPLLPAFASILFEVDPNEGKIKLTASDGDTTVTSIAELEPNIDSFPEVFTFLVPARLIGDTIKELPKQFLTLTWDEPTMSLVITTSNGKYRVAGESAQEFPQPASSQEPDVEICINKNTLINALSKVIFATSTDELRPSMTGVCFNNDFAKCLTLAATDAHRLSEVSINADDAGEEILKISGQAMTVIIPKKPLGMLKNIMENELVTVKLSDKHATFTDGNTSMLCKLIEAKFPDYKQVIPRENPFHVTIEKHEILSSLKRVGLFANKVTNQVLLGFKEDQVTVAATDVDYGKESSEVLNVDAGGGGVDLSIAFNCRFLQDVIQAIDSKDVMLKMSAPSRAAILVPSEQAPGVNQLLLIMPILPG